jgi:Cu/Ag efflux pump CusA
MQTIVRFKGYIAEYSEKFESNKSRTKSMFSFLAFTLVFYLIYFKKTIMYRTIGILWIF